MLSNCIAANISQFLVNVVVYDNSKLDSVIWQLKI